MSDRLVAPITLEGRVVRLDPLRLEHVPALAIAASEDRTNYGWTWVPDGEAEMRAWVERALADQAAGAAVPFATIERAAGKVVGSTRFMRIEYWAWPEGNANQRGESVPDAAEIGSTWLAASAQRTAINTEAKLLMLTHAFETWHVHRATLRTDERNARSRAAIERLGATLDGVLRGWEPASDGAIRNTAVYSLLESEWPAAKRALQARL
jgi:RimJ/RimL family protein N-acetyltransferase